MSLMETAWLLKHVILVCNCGGNEGSEVVCWKQPDFEGAFVRLR